MKYLTVKNILIVGLIIVILYLAMCNKPKPVEIPVTIPVKEQEKTVKEIDTEKQGSDEKFNLLIKAKDDLINKYYNNWQQTDTKLTQAERAVDELLNEVVPDTCLEMQNKLKVKFTTLKTETDNYRQSSSQTIGSLQSQLSTQKSYLTKKDNDYKRLHLALDTCFDNAKKLEKAVKDLRPRNKVAIGVVSNVYPVFGYGAGLDFISKKGIVISGSAMVMNEKSYVQVGLKKVISFRK